MAAVTTAGPAVAGPAGATSRPAPDPADGFWYQVKCRAFGPPLVTEQLSSQRLSRPLALGVLSCDGLSSAAYGTEEILYALLPFFGLAAFTLVLPLTLVVLFGVLLVVLSYREVVSVYTRAGGSCLRNLRGIREAGRVFAAPTYLFAGSVIVMITAGLVRTRAAECRWNWRTAPTGG
jgi:hypothetical protein